MLPPFSRLLSQIAAVWILALPGACSKGGSKPTLLVFAAASTADPLSELAARFGRERSIDVRLSFGASSDLARQIKAGAPADVFLSADNAQMDELSRQGLIDPAQRFELLGNQLAVIVPASSKLSFHSAAELAEVPRIALADPAAVPAGVYAKQWFQQQGIWERIEPKVVPTVDVRAALTAVEKEAVSVGIVYQSDAQQSKKVRVALVVPQAAGPKIVYPVARLSRSTQPAGTQFVQFLRSRAARDVFSEAGFVFLPPKN
jgi:molybdate transport system substrate-binding protein